MESFIDRSQYGNRKKVSIQHLLVKLIHRILGSLDKNNKSETYGAIIQLIDWSQAYDRQCPLLAVQSFIDNGVRRSLIPLLTSYFQERKMYVKWKGYISKMRDLPGGGPQGCPLGQMSYISQSNNNVTFVPNDDKFKWIDDLETLEIINLVTVGLSTYNFKNHVASDIGIDQKFLSSKNIASQEYMNKICQWTDDHKMKLNEDKSKVMIVNFTKNFQFTTRIQMNTILEIVNQTKILGLIMTSDLTWRKNTENIVSKANKRMIILVKLKKFPVPMKGMVMLYCQFIRSILEFNSNV